MEDNRNYETLTGMAGFLRDYRSYWEAAGRWGEDTAAIIMQESYRDRYSVQQVKDTFRMVRTHIRQGVNASEGFAFAASMVRASGAAIDQAITRHSSDRAGV